MIQLIQGESATHFSGKFLSERFKIMMKKIDDFAWLIQWYHDHCDGDWEHCYGIEMNTLDNPGWSIKIELLETELSEKKFSIIEVNRSDEDWFYCVVENSVFKGYGGVFNLPEIIKTFRQWAESEP